MPEQIPDPARWLADLMKTQHTVLGPAGALSDPSGTLASAATSWARAVSDFTAWQVSALQQLAAPWAAAMPGAGIAAEQNKDRRFAGEAWNQDPRRLTAPCRRRPCTRPSRSTSSRPASATGSRRGCARGRAGHDPVDR